MSILFKGKFQAGQSFRTYAPTDAHMVDDLLAMALTLKAVPPEQTSMFMQLLMTRSALCCC